MGGEILNHGAGKAGYSRPMPGMIARAALVTLGIMLEVMLGLLVATGARAQPPWQIWRHTPPHPRTHHHYRRRERRQAEPPLPALVPDSRDRLVVMPAAFAGRPYWLALAQCGGIYFKLDTLYTDAAVRARVIRPNPRASASFTRKLNEAITTATAYFDGAEHFLMTDRGLERNDAVLTYDAFSRAAGERVKSVDSALAATKSCPALYRACRAAFPRRCSEPLKPLG